MKLHAIHPNRHQGAALLLLVLALCIAFTTLLIASMGGRNALQAHADKTTRDALNEAKEALISSAVSVYTSIDATNTNRPGELLCPDRSAPSNVQYAGRPGQNGTQSCSGAQLIGRIPWFTLGLNHYRDGSGETLWYMVADPFQEQSARNVINSVNPPGNSSTLLQAATDGGITNMTANNNRAVAIIFAPGAALAGQNRSTAAQQTNPGNYLESVAPPNATAAFNNASTNPAIRRLDGPITNAAGAIVLNDHLIVITRDELMNAVRKRAAREYPIALAKQGKSLSFTCTGALPSLTPSDTYDWLSDHPASPPAPPQFIGNNWGTILTYQSPCTNPPTLE